MNHLLLIVLAASLNGTLIQPSSFPGHVLVREPMLRLVRPIEVHLHCGKGGNIEACTAFVGQRLECQCTRSETGWQMEPRAQFIPVMFVTGAQWVPHERDHIEDIRRRVEAYLHTFQFRHFETLDQCLSRADRERERFPVLMDRLKLESNADFHPGLARARSN